ncbi:MAG: hypothetical protein WDZ88_03175 [Candidatus Paceibacterota bacterium]
MFNKSSLKFTVGFLVIIVLSFGVIFASTFYDEVKSEEKEMEATAREALD